MKSGLIKLFKKTVLLITMTGFLGMSVQAPVMADMVTTGDLHAGSMIEQKRDQLRSLVAREDVARSLAAHGVSVDDVEKRLAGMTDEEVTQFHAEMDDLPAGEGVLGTVIAVLVIFMLLDIAGVTDFFPAI